MLAKKEKDIADARCFSLLLSGILGLCVCQILRFCRLLSSLTFSRPVSYRKRKKMPASGFQSPIFPESRKSQVTYLRLSPQICNESSFAGELSIPSMIIKFVILISSITISLSSGVRSEKKLNARINVPNPIFSLSRKL